MFRPATIATGGARFRLRASAADLAHALISGTTDLRPQVRAQILDALQRQGAAGRKGADYVTALHWAQAVSDGRRPPDPIIFRSLGRSVDWLAALEFFAGKYREHPAWSGREMYPFPDPVGPQPVYNMSHEEVDTLPRFLGKGVKNVDFKLAVPDGMRDALDFLHRIGMTRRDEVPVGRALVRPLQVLSAVLPQPADLGGRIRGAAIVLVEVEGRKGSARMRHVLDVAMTHDEAFRRMRATATAFLTGTGAAAGALALTTGQAATPGVLAPEQLKPAPILALLAELGLEVRSTSQALP